MPTRAASPIIGANAGLESFTAGNAYINSEDMIERLWRDLRVARIYDGSSEVQQILIAQQLRKGQVQCPL